MDITSALYGIVDRPHEKNSAALVIANCKEERSVNDHCERRWRGFRNESRAQFLSNAPKNPAFAAFEGRGYKAPWVW